MVDNTKKAPGPRLAVGQTVEVTGMARDFDAEEVEKAIGTDLRGSVLTEWESAPSVVAESIKIKGEKTSP